MQQIIQTLSPALNSRMLTAEQRQAFEQGLSLIESIPNAQSFVRDSRRFRDYHRRVRQLLTYLQTAPVPAASAAGKSPRHVGRPTKSEQAAYAALQQQKALSEARASLFPTLTPDTSLSPLTYNGIVANPNGESIAATMPHLMQLRPFLSQSLQERVNTVRDLRNEAASKAEQAKTMSEANAKLVQSGSLALYGSAPVPEASASGSPSHVKSGSAALYSEKEISALSSRAAEITSNILPSIYSDVDREIGECYLRLSPKHGDPEYIAHIQKTCNIAPQDLRTQFKPFYEKALARDPLFSQSVADKIANDRPEVKAARDAAAKHKAEADAIIKYIIRKDKPATPARVKGLTERIATLRSQYSDIVSPDDLRTYDAILQKTTQDCK